MLFNLLSSLPQRDQEMPVGLEEPVFIKSCGIVVSITQVIHISSYMSLSLMVDVLWTFKEFTLFYCDHIRDYPIIAIWSM